MAEPLQYDLFEDNIHALSLNQHNLEWDRFSQINHLEKLINELEGLKPLKKPATESGSVCVE